MRRIFIDCPQEIPCNPCQFSCKTGAITVTRLTGRPVIEPEKCVGCDNCVAACPGQACFLMDDLFSESEGTIDFPYEYLPLPVKGELRDAIDNNGRFVCSGRIVDVLERVSWHQTRVVRLAVPKKYLHEVRGMRRKPG